MKAWKVLTILMVVALSATMTAQAEMRPGTPGDGIPDIYVVPLGRADLVPANYSSPDETDFTVNPIIFTAYADPDIDKMGIFIDTDGALIGNFISIGSTTEDQGRVYRETAEFMPDGTVNPEYDPSYEAHSMESGVGWSNSTILQYPSDNVLAAQGNSSTWGQAGWTAEGGAFELAYFNGSSAATMDGVFWTGLTLEAGVDPAGLFELMHARYREPGAVEGDPTFDFDLITVPEPSTIVLLASALLGLVLLRRRN